MTKLGCFFHSAFTVPWDWQYAARNGSCVWFSLLHKKTGKKNHKIKMRETKSTSAVLHKRRATSSGWNSWANRFPEIYTRAPRGVLLIKTQLSIENPRRKDTAVTLDILKWRSWSGLLMGSNLLRGYSMLLRILLVSRFYFIKYSYWLLTHFIFHEETKTLDNLHKGKKLTRIVNSVSQNKMRNKW